MMQIVKINSSTLDLALEAALLFYPNANTPPGINPAFFETDRNRMYLAVEDGRVAGMLYGYELDRFDQPKKQLFLYSIDVLAPFRKRGIGKALVSAFLSPMNAAEYHNAFVFTSKNNTAAMRLYRSTGAAEQGPVEGPDVLFRWMPG